MENFPPNFVAGFLRLHNQYRAAHEAPPLQIDGKLNDYAQEWADVLAKNCALEYRPKGNYGENVFRSTWKKTEREIKPSDPLESWYREGRFFNYGEKQPQSLEDVRHFTQLLWKEARTIGLGIANDIEGLIYFVCNYNPPGNVADQFAKNVLPLKLEDQELLPHEAEGIRTTEIRPEVVRSMERLYAVPSEKLRVWSVWLTKIVEIADQWQKWLRAHIDFTIRLSDRLYAAEMAVRRSKMEIVELRKISSKVGHADEEEMKYLYETGDSIQGEGGSIYEEAIDMQEEEQRSSKRTLDRTSTRPEVALTTAASSVTLTPSTATIKEVSSTSLQPSQITIVRVQSAASRQASRTSVKSAPSATSRQASKTTVKLSQSATSGKASKTSVKSARSSTSKQGSRISIKSALSAFSRQASKATLKSAKSMASVKSGTKINEELRTWPIGTPWEHLGLEDAYEEEEYEKLPLPSNEQEMREFLKKFTHQATIYRSYYKHWKETADRATKEIGGRLVLATFQVQGKDQTGRTKRPVRPKPCGSVSKRKLVKSKDQQVNTSDLSQKASIASLKSGKRSTVTIKEKSQERLNKESQKSIEVPDWVRECARALEPIPYLFYVRTEPDIDIAIEHDDEEVILVDLDREGVIAQSRRVFFNLTDKPCKGGKPWI
ncbi:uncharacterized protein LOC117603236 isoform X1 [Osmia lignaria lignaria]|uniref:uncharacterized protein LOC117603236 isoform X1 n=1 Tax=Osmia lignaria lignaria TaxID=1437193 RepID=UPI0014789A26|nr:cell wall protein PRY3-like [Osmia lignaria]